MRRENQMRWNDKSALKLSGKKRRKKERDGIYRIFAVDIGTVSEQSFNFN